MRTTRAAGIQPVTPLEFLSRPADRVLAYLIDRQRQGKLSRPTFDDMTFDLIMGRSTVAAALAELTEKGFICNFPRKKRKK